jgi:hypothetical protein
MLLAALLSCDSVRGAADSTLTFVLGRPADAAGGDCKVAEWTAPWGKTLKACLDPSVAVDVTRGDLRGFRTDDREFVDGKVSAVLTGIHGLDIPLLVAATRDLPRAEAILSAWNAVERVISSEIALQPIRSVSVSQLITTPQRWFGKRVSVTGYLGELLMLSESFDGEPGVHVQSRTQEQIDALSVCQDRWVEVVGVVDSHIGLPELTRVERVRVTPGGPDCWPQEPPRQSAHPATPRTRDHPSSTTYRSNRSSASRNAGS